MIFRGGHATLCVVGFLMEVGCVSPRNEPVPDPAPPPISDASSVDAALTFDMIPTDHGSPYDAPATESFPDTGTKIDMGSGDAAAPENGGFSEFKLPGTGQLHFFDITTGSDGAVWFTLQTGKIGRLTTGGQLTLFSLPDRGDVPVGIVTGPDGNLWFTIPNRGAIGRITVAGDVLIFPTRLGASRITSGPDNYLWFTASGGWGRMSTAGELNEFDSQMSFWEILGHTTGVWVVASEDFNTKLARLSSDGSVTIVSALPDTATTLATGDDDRIWFASYGNPALMGYVDSSSDITVFPMPVPISGLLADGRGSFWSFAPPGHLLRISVDGTSRPIAIPGVVHNGSSCELTLGSDGALWFTNSADGRIQRLVF